MHSFPRTKVSSPARKPDCQRRACSVGALSPGLETPQRRRRSNLSSTPPGKTCKASPSRSPASDELQGSREVSVRQPLRDCDQVCNASLKAPSRRAWDFTSSDMSRYKLKPAELLRKQLLRMSKNHDEAASQVRKKWLQMQENIAPYLPESSDRMAASPVFASKVPTGRLPEERKPSSHRRVLSEPRPARDEVPSAEKALPSDRLDRALEAEISEFLQRSQETSPGSREKYRFLRRADPARSLPKKTSRDHLEPVSLFAGSSEFNGKSSCDSDSELGEIEDQAGQLEAQLAWWSKQRDILRGGLREAVPKEEEESSGELMGCSQWLLPPQLDAEGALESKGVQPEAPVKPSEEPCEESLPGAASSLSELIARQAAELVAAALQEANGAEQPEPKIAWTDTSAEEVQESSALLEESSAPLAEERSANLVTESSAVLAEESSPEATQRSKAIALAEQWASELAQEEARQPAKPNVDVLMTHSELQELLRDAGVAQETLAKQVFEDLERDCQQEKISLSELSQVFQPRQPEVSNFSELFNVAT